MPIGGSKARLGKLTRTSGYSSVDTWIHEMPKSKRRITWVGYLLQGYAIYCLWTRSLVWPLMWPNEILVFILALVMYWIGGNMMNRMLTSELVRKTQLEADQVAARQIQQTLTSAKVDDMPGYQVETFYKPLREVGGDYFDVIEVGDERTLVAIADVSGKGMPAALLAANIQALVRSNAAMSADPLVLTRQINRHLSRYTPTNRFATAAFLVLDRETGTLIYVNAGHDAPILFGAGTVTMLKATGMPLGLFSEATYTAETAFLPPGGRLLLFTDGLPDSIPGEDAEARLQHALADDSGNTMQILKSLIDPHFNEDDVTVLLVKRNSLYRVTSTTQKRFPYGSARIR
ncbi:MAG: PP2C family protein-serine/threonine phosphatase [Acidobacteriaceae bacterium]|nr:PP2C family protein-serine/threonine phosphatase [Acidobacteriaceae bacterium]